MRVPPVTITTPSPTLDVDGDRLLLTAWAGSRMHTLARELGGRRRPSASGAGLWTFPRQFCYWVAILEAFPAIQLTKNAEAYLASVTSPNGISIEFDKDDYYLKKLYSKLYPFQRDVVHELVSEPCANKLVAMAPGLGKSLVSLIAAAILDLQRVLIVAPLSLLSVWEYEFEKWQIEVLNRNFRLHRAHGIPPSDDGWVVTNYNTVTSPKLSADFWEQQWDLLVLDESVLVKNRKTQRFSAIKNLRESSDRVWLLSGSPITRGPEDLWSQFHLINPRSFPSYWRFVRRFCVLEETVWGTKVEGSSGRDLKNDFRDIMVVRSQEEVLPDLPDMRFETIPITLSRIQAGIYTRMLKEFVAYLDDNPDAIMSAPVKLAQLIRLQQIVSAPCNLGPQFTAASAKHDAIMELFSAGAIELPCLIWTHWRPGAEELHGRLLDLDVATALIHGGEAGSYDNIFKRYRGNASAEPDADYDVLVCSLGVGKFGHSMTQTRTVIYADKTWDADAWVQSLRRVKRIGLTHSPRIISLDAPGTIDEMVADNLAGKALDIANITNASLSTMLRSINRGFLEG